MARAKRRATTTADVTDMTPEQFRDAMMNILNAYTHYYDDERIHADMDHLMCLLLRTLGYSEGVNIFEKETRLCNL